MSDASKYLEDLVSDLETQAEGLDDSGHKALIEDLKALLAKALEGFYHDFHRNGDPTPKMALQRDLNIVNNNMQQGKYDN